MNIYEDGFVGEADTCITRKKMATPRPWCNNTFLHNNIIHMMIVNLQHPLARENIFSTIKQVDMTSSTQFTVEYT